MPASIAALPRDERGYPCPWFISWIDGKPEFRIADGRKLARAVRERLCWVCGQPLDPQQHVFVIGPMCAVNQTSAEPPSHAACAEFSVQACPFLTKPQAQRRESNLPEGCENPSGVMIRRNPGVTLLWFCRGYERFPDGNGGALFHMPNPSMVRWYAEGRKATRAEILESVEGGLPILQKMAQAEGADALAELGRMADRAMKLVPAAAPGV